MSTLPIVRELVRPLYQRSLWRPGLQLGANLALYATLSSLAIHLRWGALLWPLLGLQLAGFLAAAHDCVHCTFVDSKSGNRIVGALWCALVLVNFTSFKYPHLTHHRYTRVPGDPESAEPLRSPLDYLRKMVWQNPFRSLLRSVRAAVGVFPPWIDTPTRRRSMQKDAALVLLWVAVALLLTLRFPLQALHAYWGPLLFFNSMVSLTALPEHYDCGAGPDILSSTRTVLSNPLVRLVLWNGNFHVEHHIHPGVPSCNLPALHRQLRGSPLRMTRSYAGFHLRLLDELRQKNRLT